QIRWHHGRVLEPSCSGRVELFFSYRPPDIERASAICAKCPLRRPCAARALEFMNRHSIEVSGVWGGVTLNPNHRRSAQREALRAIAGDLVYMQNITARPALASAIADTGVSWLENLPSDRQHVGRHRPSYSARVIA